MTDGYEIFLAGVLVFICTPCEWCWLGALLMIIGAIK